jgi:hypothetical protein
MINVFSHVFVLLFVFVNHLLIFCLSFYAYVYACGGVVFYLLQVVVVVSLVLVQAEEVSLGFLQLSNIPSHGHLLEIKY